VSQRVRGELRLGLPLLGSDTLFAGLFAEYRRRYPNIATHLLNGGSRSPKRRRSQWTGRLSRSLGGRGPRRGAVAQHRGTWAGAAGRGAISVNRTDVTALGHRVYLAPRGVPVKSGAGLAGNAA